MKAFSLAVSAAALLIASSVWAMPGMGGSADGEAMSPAVKEKVQASFDKMDTNKDGKVSRQEFMATHPTMTEEAFTKIDSSRDDALTLEEWISFMAGHASGMRQAPAGQMPPASSAPAAGQKPLITPPAK